MPPNSQIDDLMRQSTFTFVGTVKRLNAATMAAVPVTENTAVVTVDEVLQAPPMLADLAGSDVTVQLSSAQQVQEGQQATFFTTGWIYGTSIAVREVGHVEGRVGAERADELAALSPAMPENRTARLRQRIADADAVVVGMVSSIKFPEGYNPYGPASEHAPKWREATIEVQSVEKGDLPQDRITAIFSASDDVRWYRTPTFQVGQKGLFLLDKREIPELQREEYVALDPLDYQPPEQLDSIQGLIGSGGGPGEPTEPS
ncbi:MAG: hypothetical protein M3246_09705 [Actinomycetota bacterium]|nr:hypothetical protein [Actinomycetota bacterium]